MLNSGTVNSERTRTAKTSFEYGLLAASALRLPSVTDNRRPTRHQGSLQAAFEGQGTRGRRSSTKPPSTTVMKDTSGWFRTGPGAGLTGPARGGSSERGIPTIT